MALPSSPEQRKLLLDNIKEAVAKKLFIQSADEHIRDIRKNVKEQFQMEAKEFNYYVKAFIDENYPEESFSELEDLYHSYEILKELK